MGSQNDRNVRGSQSFLMMMIHPMISPRTRSSSAATQPGQRPAPAAAAAALTTRRPARLRTVTAEGPAMPNACARRSGGARSSVGRGAFVSWAGRVCQLGGARSSVGRGAFVSWAGRVRQLRGGRPLRSPSSEPENTDGQLETTAAVPAPAPPPRCPRQLHACGLQATHQASSS
jgi:hypothetical protein